jgi:hypothetical protein
VRRRWIALSLALALGAALAWYLALSERASKLDPPPPTPPTLAAQARAALSRALAYLEGERERLSLDAVFCLRMVEGALPGTRAGIIASLALPSAKRHPRYRLFAELAQVPRRPHPVRPLPPIPAEGAPDPLELFDEPASDACLAEALRCRWSPRCREYEARTGRWGYTLTHQVLFFLLAKEKGCAWGIDFDGWIGHLAAAMLREQTAYPKFNDLAAERIGLGLYAGFQEFARPEWIGSVVAAERHGCWAWEEKRDRCSDHTTGMAAWVLALYLARR